MKFEKIQFQLPMFCFSFTSLLHLRKKRSNTQLISSHLQVVRGSNGDGQEPLHCENGQRSVSLSAHTFLYISQSTHLLVSLPICLSVCLLVCLSVCLLVHLSFCLSVCLSVCLLFFNLLVLPSLSLSFSRREQNNKIQYLSQF